MISGDYMLIKYRSVSFSYYIDSKGRDQGSNVRRISQSLVALLMLRNKYKKYMKWLLLTVTRKFASSFLITLLMALFNFQYIGSNMRHQGSMLEGYLKSLVALVNDKVDIFSSRTVLLKILTEEEPHAYMYYGATIVGCL
ncbi:uncharacterized protein LOC111365943 isoform X2 [Olea europaea var. sylvestris]|uniref:uncharacterized protein LOC111365943 isoform X2 n=1 Tax=Olea europaea var. sylvestris TaxID=158386 RepID=UPI000C1D554D|nr:uncharacterized protein LOC111365943 isoform X2 [Olea europaea var. sylvestris]